MGRPPIIYKSLLKAIIYKNTKNVFYLSDLAKDLQNNPNLALIFGFNTLRLPRVDTIRPFYEILKIESSKR